MHEIQLTNCFNSACADLLLTVCTHCTFDFLILYYQCVPAYMCIVQLSGMHSICPMLPSIDVTLSYIIMEVITKRFFVTLLRHVKIVFLHFYYNVKIGPQRQGLARCQPSTAASSRGHVNAMTIFIFKSPNGSQMNKKTINKHTLWKSNI